jgi:hypothetical protein
LFADTAYQGPIFANGTVSCVMSLLGLCATAVYVRLQIREGALSA